MMLTTISGRSGKVQLMDVMCRGINDITNNAVFVDWVDTIANLPSPSYDSFCCRLERNSNFESNVNNLLMSLINKDYRSMFIYGNFSIDESAIIKKYLESIAEEVGSQLYVYITVQDSSVNDDEIVIREYKL